MPDARCTRGLVRNTHKKNAHTSIQGSGGTPAFPAQGKIKSCYGVQRAVWSSHAIDRPNYPHNVPHAFTGIRTHHCDTSRDTGTRSWHARSASAHWKAAPHGLKFDRPPQAVQRPVARARHRADVPAQQDQRHMGAEGQRRPRRILDQGLRPGRRFRGCRRQERADVLSRRRTSRRSWRAARTAAPTPHRSPSMAR